MDANSNPPSPSGKSDAPINPYAAPESLARPDLETLLAGTPLTFRFDLTRKDIARALGQTGIRPEFRNSRRATTILFICLAFLILGLSMNVARGSAEAQLQGALIFAIVCMLAPFAAVLMTRRRFLNAHIHIQGPTSGRWDGDGLWIEQKNQTRFRNLNALVASASNKEWWATTFDETRTQMEILPKRGFSDPGRMEEIVAAVDQFSPESRLQLMDLRRLEMPTAETRFESDEDAIHFSGKLYIEDLTGTRFRKLGNRYAWLTLIPLAVILGLGLFWILAQSQGRIQWFLVLLLVGFPIWAFARAFFRIRKTRRQAREQESGDTVVWASKGWFDGRGVVSMTISGESKTDWPHFPMAQVTPTVIALQSRSNHVWHLFGRRQFPDDASFESAANLVRNKIDKVTE